MSRSREWCADSSADSTKMETEKKLEILGAAAKYDVCASTCGPVINSRGRDTIGSVTRSGICHSFTQDGRCVSLLKVLLTNTCKNNCQYCVNRRSNDFQRTEFESEELAHLFIEMYKRNYVEGLFLSSGVKNSTAHTMQKMIETVEILRFKYRYIGYIHLKMLPGTSEDLVNRAAELSDRLSINLECPNPDRLQLIAKEKDFKKDLIKPITHAQHALRAGKLKSGITTQFVVGAAKESDSEILFTSNWLYKQRDLRRAYFSAYIPLDTENPPPLIREHRLYQSDFLMRVYGFELKDFIFEANGNLNLKYDPKFVYAVKNRDKFPVEINKAPFENLLKVPGIGPTAARRIYRARKEYRFTQNSELKNLGVVMKRAAPFLLINGRKAGEFYEQISLGEHCAGFAA